MNIDELKLILDTVSKLGEAGKEAFVWWLVADKALPVLSWLAFFGTVSYTAIKVVRLLTRKPVDDDRSQIEVARDALRTHWLYSKDPTMDSAAMHKLYQAAEAEVTRCGGRAK
jgi:hypothetical protein